jgi:hypothetical protein
MAQPRSAGPSLAEQLLTRLIRPLDLVILTRERLQATLDEAAEHGRITRSDANDLAIELVKWGRLQTDELLERVEQLFGRGRERIVRGAGKARRADPSDPALAISGYDDLTARQVQSALGSLTPAQLRKVRDYERRHANRKSVLAAIDKALR